MYVAYSFFNFTLQSNRGINRVRLDGDQHEGGRGGIAFPQLSICQTMLTDGNKKNGRGYFFIGSWN